MSINYEDYDELDSDSSFDSAINIIEDQDGGTIVFNSSELMSANFDGGIPKTVVATSIESETDPLDMGDYIFWNFSTNQSFNPSPTDTVDGTIDESDDPADYYDTYLVTGIESDEDEVTYNISVMLEDEEYVIEGVGGTQTIYAIKEDWDEKELGTTGWLITSSGNAIFTNIAARGRIEAKEGFLESLDVNGTLRIIGTPVDDETEETEAVARLVVVQADGSPKTQPSVVVNKNGLIVRSNVGGTVKKIFKVPLDGKNIFISGYTNDDNNKDPDDPNPPDLTGNEIVIGGKNNNLTLNGGKGNKAIFTTIGGTKTDFGDSTPGFILQAKDLDGAGNWKTRLKLAGSGTGAGSMIFDGTNLTITGEIRATSGYIGGTTSGWQITSDRISSAGGSTNKIYLVNNITNPKIAISSNTTSFGSHSAVDTPFYVDSTGAFSLSNQLVFNPGSGNAQSFTAVASWSAGASTITISSATFTTNIKNGLTVTGTNIPVGTYVTAVNAGTRVVTLNQSIPISGTNITVSFMSDDLGELNIAGRIRGVIDSVNQIISPRLATSTTNVTVSGTSPNQTATITTAGHAFLANERILIESMPTTAGLNNLNNREFVIESVSDSVTFTISIAGVTGVTTTAPSGTNTTAGRITLRELTMGLHPAQGILGTDTWYHPAGTGIQLDKYNWWLTNNYFRVGSTSNYMLWNGTALRVTGQIVGSTFTIQDNQATPQTGTNIPLTGVITFRSISTGGVVSPAYIEIDNWDSNITLSGSNIPINQGSFRIFGSSNVLLFDPNDIQSVIKSSQTANILRIQRLGGALELASSGVMTTVKGDLTVNGSFSPSSISTGTVSATGLISTDGRFRGALAGENSPTFSFKDDDDTGMYNYAANIIGFTTNSTERLRIGSTIFASTSITATAYDTSANGSYNVTGRGGSSAAFYANLVSGYTGNGIYLFFTPNSGGAGYNFLKFEGGDGQKARIGGAGAAHFAGSVNANSTGDYAEYFEWEDGNPNNEDRVGYSVVLVENKIKKAEQLDIPIGIVSATAAMVADSYWANWQGKFELDEFGRNIQEECNIYKWIDESGNEVAYEDGYIPEGIVIPENHTIEIGHRNKISENYNPNEEYVPRENRKEWSVVGLMGKIRLRKGQPVAPNWIKLRDISENVEEWLVR